MNTPREKHCPSWASWARREGLCCVCWPVVNARLGIGCRRPAHRPGAGAGESRGTMQSERERQLWRARRPGGGEPGFRGFPMKERGLAPRGATPPAHGSSRCSLLAVCVGTSYLDRLSLCHFICNYRLSNSNFHAVCLCVRGANAREAPMATPGTWRGLCKSVCYRRAHGSCPRVTCHVRANAAPPGPGLWAGTAEELIEGTIHRPDFISGLATVSPWGPPSPPLTPVSSVFFIFS